MKIAICDDELYFQNELREIIKRNYNSLDLVVDCYSSGNELIKALENNLKYEIIFMDIEMPDESGLEIAKRLREMKIDDFLIFTTSHEEFVFKGYEVEAFRYLIKPLKEEDVLNSINSIINKKMDTKFINLHNSDREILVREKEIIYIESIRVNLKIVTSESEYMMRSTFQKIMDNLSSDFFCKCHRSYIVNFAHIKEIRKSDFVMDNGDIIPISRSYRNKVKEEFFDYINRSAV